MMPPKVTACGYLSDTTALLYAWYQVQKLLRAKAYPVFEELFFLRKGRNKYVGRSREALLS